MPKVFVDLDDTLIDTSWLKEEMIGIITGMGVPREVALDRYQKSKDKNGIPIMSDLARSFSDYNVDPEILSNKLESMYSSITEERLLLDRLAYLESKYPRGEFEYILITKGEENTQHRKINAFRLYSAFDKVLVVSKPKAEAIRELIEPGEFFVLLDDKESEREMAAEISDKAVVLDPEEIDRRINLESGSESSIFREGK